MTKITATIIPKKEVWKANGTNINYVDGNVGIGTTTPTEKLDVNGNIKTTGTIITGDHGTDSTDEVVNVCYGTGNPPTASTTTEGALFVKYTA